MGEYSDTFQRSCEDLAAFRFEGMVLSGPGRQPERFLGSAISASAFRLIGVRGARPSAWRWRWAWGACWALRWWT